MKNQNKFHVDEIPKEGLQCNCLSIILIDFVFRTNKNYYSQAFLEVCKYLVKVKKMHKFITDNLEIYSDEENCNEKNSDQ